MLPPISATGSFASLSAKGKIIYDKAIFIWILALLTTAVLYFLTIDVAPNLDGDEFTLLDLGRVILYPHTNWSIVWMTNKNEPIFLLSYAGPVLQEIIYEWFGEYGPRVSSVIGAIAATMVMYRWLCSRGTSSNAALTLSLIFFLDPLFVQSYTLGRVDGWTMFLCISSCWVLRSASNNLEYNLFSKSFKWHLFFGGSLLIAAFFVWPSAIFLFPLTFLELFYFNKKYQSALNKSVERYQPFVLFLSGAIASFILFISPVLPQMIFRFSDVVETFKANSQSRPWWGSQGSIGMGSFVALLKVLKFTPLLFIFSIAAIIIEKQWKLIFALFPVVLLMLATVVYVHRVQYLLPYFIVAITAIFSNKFSVLKYNTIIRKSLLIILLIWCVSLSIIARTILAFDHEEEKNRNLISNAASNTIGKGNYGVLLFFPYELYFSGRSLGWQMYAPYIESSDRPYEQILHQVLQHVQYAIIPEDKLTNELTKQLNKEGMSIVSTYNNYRFKIDQPYLTDYSKTTNMDRLRILFRISRQPYGPYKIFRKQTN